MQFAHTTNMHYKNYYYYYYARNTQLEMRRMFLRSCFRQPARNGLRRGLTSTAATTWKGDYERDGYVIAKNGATHATYLYSGSLASARLARTTKPTLRSK